MTSQQKAAEAALSAARQAWVQAKPVERREVMDKVLLPAMKANAAAWGNPW
jgi:hypothetical protein